MRKKKPWKKIETEPYDETEWLVTHEVLYEPNVWMRRRTRLPIGVTFLKMSNKELKERRVGDCWLVDKDGNRLERKWFEGTVRKPKKKQPEKQPKPRRYW